MASVCPDTPARVHASCEMTVTFDQSCEKVKNEVEARANSSNWVDPHNKGTYTLEIASGTRVAISRLSGDGLYTDKMALEFADTDSNGCIVSACSASQVTSVLDFSTNFCNLYNLYCNSEDGCAVVGDELTHSERYDSCWQRSVEKCNTMKKDEAL
eukprot:CAMPEP_0119029422 /NCGR_PEP_ID=MMETSP1176-20130426/40511_1 /TAXON_ID=265551 /ORGANISM="Synedropsis recta cf, Strain CCMP1620" /LENGTH=155 /DNA_ID=CAMNT_0006985763 /DNA_START=1148 /DNA_END=1615 /DNA_ORIENTATION=-